MQSGMGGKLPPCLYSPTERGACFIHTEQSSECKLASFRGDQNNNRGLGWEEQS